ncbi:hypothetical protein HDV06_000947 [Boothiomyces sp. JEL0866]|nr:hypothetical protein HDV06_000947 [Boothiomyces sp. JEL0866]
MKVPQRTNSSKCAHTHEILDHGGPTSFGRTYFSLCQLYSLPVLTHVINHDNNHLFLDVERIVKDEEWSPIIKSLRKNRDLAKICVYSVESISITDIGNRFEGHSGKSIVRILPDLIGIKNLSLSRCKIGDSGIFVLAPAIRTILHLQVLNLSGCELGEKGAFIIAAFLKSLAVRRQADKWAYSLRNSTEVDQMLPSKEAPCPLKRLVLCCNNFGDNGCVPIFELLFEEVGLKGLDLQSNNLTEKSGLFAYEMMRNNTEIILLDLRNNKISGETLNLVHKRLESNLMLDGNQDQLMWLDTKNPLKSSYYPERVKTRTLMHTKSSIKKYKVIAPKEKKIHSRDITQRERDKNNPTKQGQNPPVNPKIKKEPKKNNSHQDERKLKEIPPKYYKSPRIKPKPVDFSKVQSVLDLYYPPQTESEALQETIDYELEYLEGLYKHIEQKNKQELEKDPGAKINLLERENQELKLRIEKLEDLLITSKHKQEKTLDGPDQGNTADANIGAIETVESLPKESKYKLVNADPKANINLADTDPNVQKENIVNDSDLLNILESSIASFHKILDVWEKG